MSARLEDVNKAIWYRRKVLAALGDSDRQNRIEHSKALAELLSYRHDNFTWEVTDIEEAIALYRFVLSCLPSGDSLRWTVLNNLAAFLLDRHSHRHELGDLEETIKLFRDALALLPCAVSQLNLAHAIQVRFEHIMGMGTLGRVEDLDEAIRLCRRAVRSSENIHERATMLHGLAVILHLRFTVSHRDEDLEESIDFGRQELKLRPDGDPKRFAALQTLSISLQDRFERNSNERVEDLQEAIRLQRRALELCPRGSVDRPTSLRNLGACLLTLFKRCGQQEHLDEAVALFEEEVKITSESLRRAGALNSLAMALARRLTIKYSKEDQARCIALCREAVALTPQEDPHYSTHIFNLAGVLYTRYGSSGEMKDLEESIEYGRAALLHHPQNHPDRASSLNNLANSLSKRYEQSGSLDDLEELISLRRETLSLEPEQSLYRPLFLTNLGRSILERYERIRREDDLEESIQMQRECLEHCPEGHHARVLSLTNLADALRLRFDYKVDIDDLVEAGGLYSSLLKLHPEGDSDRPKVLWNIGLCFEIMFRYTEEEDHLEHAIAAHRDSLRLLPQGHTQRSDSLNSLASCLRNRFSLRKREQDIRESIEIHREVLTLRPDGDAFRASCLRDLASSLLSLYRETKATEVLTEVFELYQTAAEYSYSSVLTRVEIAEWWARFAREFSHSSTLRAYRTALSLMQQSLDLSPTLQTQHDILTKHLRMPALALDAASLLIAQGELTEAVKVLEQGRALLWSELRGFRTSLEVLEKSDERLATTLKDINRQLEDLATISETSPLESLTVQTQLANPLVGDGRIAAPGGHASGLRRSSDQMLTMRRHLVQQQADVIDEIRRTVPGFENFLKPTPFSMLQEAAAEGPVILINHCRYRCDAVIVLAHSPPVSVPLDSEFYADSTKLCEQLLETRKNHKAASAEYDQKLREVMAMLWERAVRPIVQKLTEVGVPSGSRIWWCPTSVLSGLPFHAAGPFHDAAGTPKYLLDDYTSSYTPTLNSLISARSGKPKGRIRLLVIGDTQLPSAEEELDTIRRYAMPVKFLVDGDASRHAVLSTLSECKWVHFACHGRLDVKPFDSSFKLSGSGSGSDSESDAGLTLLDIARAELPNAEFAFLSACHTAELPVGAGQDEVLHLAAAMQFCGFRSVIGTMWELFDVDGPAFARQVYARLIEKPAKGEARFKRSAGALRAAAVALKAQEGIATERWVNVVHIGA